MNKLEALARDAAAKIDAMDWEADDSAKEKVAAIIVDVVLEYVDDELKTCQQVAYQEAREAEASMANEKNANELLILSGRKGAALIIGDRIGFLASHPLEWWCDKCGAHNTGDAASKRFCMRCNPPERR